MERSVISAPPAEDKYWSFGCNALRSAGRFCFSVAVARLAGVSDYAVFIQLIAAEVIVLAVVQSLAVAPLISLAPGRSAADVATLTSVARRRTAFFAIGCGAAALVGVPLLLNAAVRPAVAVGFAVSQITWVLATLSRGWFCVAFRSRRAFAVDLVAISGVGITLACTQALGIDTLASYWWASAVAGLLTLVSLRLPQNESQRSKESARTGADFRSMAKQMTIGTLANALGSRVHPFVLGAFGGAVVVASFGVAATLVGPLRMFSMAIGNVLRPRMSLHFNQGRVDELRKLLLAASAGLGLAGTLLAMVFVGYGDKIGAQLFGDQIGPLSTLLIFASLYAATEGVGSCFVIALQIARGDGTALATRLRILATTIALILLGPICLRFGAAGAFGLAAAIELGFVGVTIFACRRILRLSPVDYTDTRARSLANSSPSRSTSSQAAPERIASSQAAARSVTSG